MDTDPLVRMANRIAEFFAAMPDRDEAVDGVATHLRRFWEPRMRRALLDHAARGGAGLHPLVIAAIERRGAELAPKP
jgi:formate dehydrogenase subunit delta